MPPRGVARRSRASRSDEVDAPITSTQTISWSDSDSDESRWSTNNNKNGRSYKKRLGSSSSSTSALIINTNRNLNGDNDESKNKRKRNQSNRRTNLERRMTSEPPTAQRNKKMKSKKDKDKEAIVTTTDTAYDRNNSNNNKRKRKRNDVDEADEARKDTQESLKGKEKETTIAVDSKNLKEGEIVDEEELCCSICLETPPHPASINGCTHQFCYDCILQWSKHENTCPNCKKRFTEIKDTNPVTKSGTKRKKSRVAKVQQKNQRSNEGSHLSMFNGFLNQFQMFFPELNHLDTNFNFGISHRTISQIGRSNGFPRPGHRPTLNITTPRMMSNPSLSEVPLPILTTTTTGARRTRPPQRPHSSQPLQRHPQPQHLITRFHTVAVPRRLHSNIWANPSDFNHPVSDASVSNINGGSSRDDPIMIDMDDDEPSPRGNFSIREARRDARREAISDALRNNFSIPLRRRLPRNSDSLSHSNTASGNNRSHRPRPRPASSSNQQFSNARAMVFDWSTIIDPDSPGNSDVEIIEPVEV